MSHKMPSDSEIRQRIDAIEDEKYRNAFRFQYLAAARISEVCGRYAPMGDDVFVVDFDGEMAALFIVKTAKRKGRLRPVAVPLRADYEPWADKVRQYFAYHRGEYPFRFAEKWATSIRYMQWQAEKAFEGLEWPMIAYTMKKGDVSIKIPSRWKGVTSHVMRKRRTVTLAFEYGFSGMDLSVYGGWTSAQAEVMPQAIKHYLYVDIQSAKENIELLKRLAGRYFSKLCKPYRGD